MRVNGHAANSLRPGSSSVTYIVRALWLAIVACHGDAVDVTHGPGQPRHGGTSFGSASLSSWGSASHSPPGQVRAAPPVVHFLFLVERGLSHVDVWQHFFGQAPPGSFRVWVHCTQAAECEASEASRLPTATVVPSVNSAYCYDLVTPTVQLMRFALAANATESVEKFVLMSDTSLPVKPFDAVYRALTADDDSDFCVAPVNEWRHAHVDGIKYYLPKHSQWVILNRDHAATMVREWTPSKSWDRFMGWWSLEIRTSTGHHARSIPSRRFMTHMTAGAYACTDEQAVIATIYGAIEPDYSGKVAMPGFGRPVKGDGVLAAQELALQPPLSLGVQGRCRTFTVFQAGQPLGNLTAEIMDAIGTDVQSSTAFVDPDASHPLVFKQLGPRLTRALRASPFLFARKFAPGNSSGTSLMSEYSELVQQVTPPQSQRLNPLLSLVEPLEHDADTSLDEQAVPKGLFKDIPRAFRR